MLNLLNLNFRLKLKLTHSNNAKSKSMKENIPSWPTGQDMSWTSFRKWAQEQTMQWCWLLLRLVPLSTVSLDIAVKSFPLNRAQMISIFDYTSAGSSSGYVGDISKALLKISLSLSWKLIKVFHLVCSNCVILILLCVELVEFSTLLLKDSIGRETFIPATLCTRMHLKAWILLQLSFLKFAQNYSGSTFKSISSYIRWKFWGFLWNFHPFDSQLSTFNFQLPTTNITFPTRKFCYKAKQSLLQQK